MELVVVITVLGLLAAIGLPRFFRQETYALRAYFDEMMAMTRYAQKLAVAQRGTVYVQLAADHIALCRDAACAMPVPSPAGNTPAGSAPCSQANWFCQPAPAGIAVTLANAQGLQPLPQVIAFQASGSTTLASNVTIAAQDGSDRPSFTIEAYTGYVHQ